MAAPTFRAVAVTPSDSADISPHAEAFMVTTTTGSVAVITDAGATLTFTSVALNTVIPVRINRVKSTGTTAAGILALHYPSS